MDDPFEETEVELPPAISTEEENVAELANNEPQDIPLAVTKKKKTMKPQPKLNSTRLMGPRGLPGLEKEFDGVRFKGHGYEEQDLNLLMSHLEHWAHRLFPSMTFDDCLDKLERLGHKREVQLCMKKLRMGMPLLNADEESTVITTDGPMEGTDGNEDDIDNEILNLPMNDDF